MAETESPAELLERAAVRLEELAKHFDDYVRYGVTPDGPDTDRDQCPTNRRAGYAPTCGHPEADHFGHQCPEENPVSDMVLIPAPDGTHRTIEADAIRALVGYIEQRDATTSEEQPAVSEEVSHVVTDSSDDPEHIDDCPGCEASEVKS